MTDWLIVSGPATRAPDNDLSTARGRRFSFDLPGTSSFGFTLDGRHDSALSVLELATDVHAVRDGAPIYTGRVGGTTSTIGGDAHALRVTTNDTRWLLGRRLVQKDRTYTGVDVGTFWRDMHLDAQTGIAAGLNLVLPTAAPVTGVTMTRTSKAGATVLSELQAAAGGEQGGTSVYDFDLAPGWGPRAAQLFVPGRGRAVVDVLTSIFDGDHPYSSSIASIERTLETKDYANTVRVVGGVKRVEVTVSTPNETPTTAVLAVARGTRAVATTAGTTSLTAVRGNTVVSDSGSAIVTKIGEDTSTVSTGSATTVTTSTTSNSKGETITIEVPTDPVTLSDGTSLWEVGPLATAEAYTDLLEQAEVATKAASRLAELRQVAPSYEITLKDGYWRGPGHIWLGDTVRVVIRDGRLLEDVTLRVTHIDVDLDDDGDEHVSLTVGPPATHLLTHLLAQQRALATVQRLWVP